MTPTVHATEVSWVSSAAAKEQAYRDLPKPGDRGETAVARRIAFDKVLLKLDEVVRTPEPFDVLRSQPPRLVDTVSPSKLLKLTLPAAGEADHAFCVAWQQRRVEPRLAPLLRVDVSVCHKPADVAVALGRLCQQDQVMA